MTSLAIFIDFGYDNENDDVFEVAGSVRIGCEISLFVANVRDSASFSHDRGLSLINEVDSLSASLSIGSFNRHLLER